MATINIRPGMQPAFNATGVTAGIFKVSLSVTLSVGDVHLIGKIPHGAIPLEAIWYPGAAAATGLIAKFGTSASQEAFLASDSYAESGITLYRNIKALGTAARISLSDDANVRYDYVTMVGTAGISIGHVGDLVVYYQMPGPTL